MHQNGNSFQTLDSLTIKRQSYRYYSLPALEKQGFREISRLPYSLKIVLENLLRFEDGVRVTKKDISILANWPNNPRLQHEILFRPARVLMQDFTGVPAIVDLAAMRDAIVKRGGHAEKINPLTPVDLVIDHSIQVDQFAAPGAFQENITYEMSRNRKRYEFLRWGQKAFKNFRVVPPGTGICHQVNLEYLAQCVWQSKTGNDIFIYPDTLVGTDSHTTMINGLGVLGWGVGGIEAEAVMLGQSLSMLIPEVVGFQLIGQLKEGITATDLVLTITQMLRAKNVVGKFVEFYGSGLDELSLPDRATIANMAPEYGATCGFFPIDRITLDYLTLTGRDPQVINLVEAYTKQQGLWRDNHQPPPFFTESLTLDLGHVEPCVSGPKRPQDRVSLSNLSQEFHRTYPESNDQPISIEQNGEIFSLQKGDVVIAAITSCTNTSNPSVLMAAGLLAKKAVEKGLSRKPWVKTSLAPGSKVVTSYLQEAGLQTYLDKLGFNLVGYGCTTCIGNSGPLPENIASAIDTNNLVVSAVLSGNRNFEGRVHPQVKANWLASPPLVVAYALAGTVDIDLMRDPIGKDSEGKSVFLKDIWPTQNEIKKIMGTITQAMFNAQYADVFEGDAAWKLLKVPEKTTYQWDSTSTYIQHPPYFMADFAMSEVKNIYDARVLALLGDSITTDHISPAGSIKTKSPAGQFLLSKNVLEKDFNSYGARRGNHEVMMRGTFANIRIRNEMLFDVEGGFTRHFPSGEVMSIYDAAMRYQKDHIPLVIVAGKEYGTGSSRDWAAKGTRLLGVKAVIAESFERIHRSNLIGMGVLPLEFVNGVNRKTLELKGNEIIYIEGLEDELKTKMHLQMTITRENGTKDQCELLCRLDTTDEISYYKSGGILQFVLNQL